MLLGEAEACLFLRILKAVFTVLAPAVLSPSNIADFTVLRLLTILSTTLGAALSVSVNNVLAAGKRKRPTELKIPPPH